jgi:hypothetical protein
LNFSIRCTYILDCRKPRNPPPGKTGKQTSPRPKESFQVLSCEARERGLLTRGPAWAGSVVSVYRRAVNIRRPDGLLVSLVQNRGQMSALSVHVPALFSPGPASAAGIAPGGRASYDGRRLLAAGRSVLLDGAPWYDSTLRLASRPCFSEAKRAWLRRALLARGQRGGLLGLVAADAADNVFARRAAGILGAVAADGPEPRLRGLAGLVGLGIGFTPSGDDFLAGLLLGEALAGRKEPLRLDRAEIRAALGKTNDGGRSLLHQVLSGHFPHYLIETAGELAAAADAAGIEEAVARAVSHGETSGTDTLTGLLWYLERTGGRGACRDMS